MSKTVALLIFISLLCGCAVRKRQSGAPQTVPTAAAGTRTWTKVAVPFRPENITAVGNVFWVCGADESIASSSDGGSTWKLRHQKRNGDLLLNIAFVDEKIGHAAGTGGVLLSTTDGGKTWKSHVVGDTVQAFSFSDAINGIAVIGGYITPRNGMDVPTFVNSVVKLTHNGGEEWEEVSALSAGELLPFTDVVSIAALNKSRYLMIRRQPEIEDTFVVTQDGGKSWKLVHMQNDATNRVLARMVFVHRGEYWAFGMELVHRDKGGGYGVPLTLHSGDGETWLHGIGGPDEFDTCNSQGCYLWDGAVETLYGEHEEFWALPNDGSLSSKWAIAADHACTVGFRIQCGPVAISEQPPPRPEH